MRRWKYVFLTVAGLSAITLVVLAAIEFWRSGLSAGLGATIAAAVVALMALANTALGAAATEDRSQFANAFEIARRWDEAPIVDARNLVRPYLATPTELVAAATADQAVARALIDFTNFFWNMAAAIELQWADPKYLRLRFSESLDTLLPAIEALVQNSSDKGANAGLEAINGLRRGWLGDRPARIPLLR